MIAGIIVALLGRRAFFKGKLKPTHETQGVGNAPHGITHFSGNSATTIQPSCWVQGGGGLAGLPMVHLVGSALIIVDSFWRAESAFNDYFELSVGNLVSAVFRGTPRA